MNKKSFTIIKHSKNIKNNVLFCFTNENLNYIVYKDNTNKIFGSKYQIHYTNLMLEPIEDDYIWDIIDKELSDQYE